MSNEVKRWNAAEGGGCELAPPGDSGDYVESDDYEALMVEIASLTKWKQTAEYWYGQYRFVKHGESSEQYPTEGKLDDWHNSYHTS